MSDRLFERLFSEAAAQAEAHLDAQDVEGHAQKRQRTEEDGLRRKTTDMTASDAIQRILLADKDRDYFRMLALPLPDVDALGRPKWDVAPAEISKAYRKLSILVHPDKNPGEEARQAFEVLNKAHRLLKDAGELETILKEQMDRAKGRREEEEAKATLEERIALNARQNEEARGLRKRDAEALNAEIVRQMQEKQERARRKKEGESGSRYRRRQDDNSDDEEQEEERRRKRLQDEVDVIDDGGSGSDGGEAEKQRRRQAMAKRRQQQLRKKTSI